VDKFHGKGDDSWTLLQKYTAIGDADENRYLFGVYGNRRAIYKPIPTDIEYTRGVFDRRRRIYIRYGGEIAPWDVLPGKWLEASDLDLSEGRLRIWIYLRMSPRCLLNLWCLMLRIHTCSVFIHSFRRNRRYSPPDCCPNGSI